MLMLIFSVNVTWYRKSCKYFNDLKNVDSKYDDYYDVSVNKHGVRCGKLLRFREND